MCQLADKGVIEGPRRERAKPRLCAAEPLCLAMRMSSIGHHESQRVGGESVAGQRDGLLMQGLFVKVLTYGIAVSIAYCNVDL